MDRDSSPQGKQAQSPDPTPIVHQEASKSQEAHHITDMITSHGHLRKHLVRAGIFNGNPACKKCGQYEETADHASALRLRWANSKGFNSGNYG